MLPVKFLKPLHVSCSNVYLANSSYFLNILEMAKTQGTFFQMFPLLLFFTQTSVVTNSKEEIALKNIAYTY